MAITEKPFGNTAAGNAVKLYTITNKNGASVSIITYGGIIQSLNVPDKTGKLVDVSLGCDNIEDYERQGASLGALIGRVSGRLQNSEITLEGVTYKLCANDGKNHLHGGKVGFSKRVWGSKINGETLELSLLSPDGEENYPGNLQVTVVYSFSDNNELLIDYTAVTDKDTPVKLTNHCYFNLSGEASGTILDDTLMLNCDTVCESNEELIETGKVVPVAGTPLDFKTPHAFGERINDSYPLLKSAGGYDHYFLLNRTDNSLMPAAELYSKKTGILMLTRTTAAGVQLYTGNFMDNLPAKGGRNYNKREGVCLETQSYPNFMYCKNFPSIVLHKGETYHEATVFQFLVK